MPGVVVHAVDAGHAPLPPGTEGIIRLRTPADITAHVDDEAASRTAFRDG